MSGEDDRWWEGTPLPGSMLEAMTPEQRAALGRAVEASRAFVREWEVKLARGLTDAEVDQVMGMGAKK